MSGKTFVFRTNSVDPAPLEDGLAALINEHPDPSVYLEIKRIRLLPVSGQTALAGGLTVSSISAISGGDDVSYAKHDTDSADLPATVLIRSIPDSVTETGVYRRAADVPLLQSTLALGCVTRLQSGSISSARTQYQDLVRFPISSDVERIVLREGEGVALIQGAFSVPHAGAIGVCVRETTSGACYVIRSRDIRSRGARGLAQFALLNGTGSGVVLEVYSIEYPEEGEATIPGVRIARIEGIRGGVEAPGSILKLDTAADIPSTIRAVEGPFRATLAGENTGGAQIDWHTRHGIDGISVAQQQNLGVFRRLTSPVTSTDQSSAFVWEVGRSLVWSTNETYVEGIRLRSGQGIAILAGRAGTIDNSTFNCYQVEITFNYHPPAFSRRSSMALGI